MTDRSAVECLVRLTFRAKTPRSRLLRSLPFRPALRSVIDSASGGLLTAFAASHPTRCTGIGFVLRPQPDPDVPQARCSIRDCTATPASRLALTLTPLIWCCIPFPAHPAALACGSEVRRCEPWAHSSLSRHPSLPCLLCTAHCHRLSTKFPQNRDFAAILLNNLLHECRT